MSRSTTFSAERKEAPADEAKINKKKKMQTIARAPIKMATAFQIIFLLAIRYFFMR